MSLRERQEYIHTEDALIPDGRNGTIRQDTVSTMEVWCECLYRDRASLKRTDSNELIGMLEKLGWKRREKKQRIPIYGVQYVFERSENDTEE